MIAPNHTSILCITPDCKRVRKVRGWCFLCCKRLLAEIRAGRTTRVAAEASGLVLPVDREGRRRWGAGRG